MLIDCMNPIMMILSATLPGTTSSFEKVWSRKVTLRLYEMLTNVVTHMPPELREALGVYHVKFCMMDNTVILTGANLSKEY